MLTSYNRNMTIQVFYQCPLCGLHYIDEEIAKQCEVYCKEYNGCSLEITIHAVERSKAIENHNPNRITD